MLLKINFFFSYLKNGEFFALFFSMFAIGFEICLIASTPSLAIGKAPMAMAARIYYFKLLNLIKMFIAKSSRLRRASFFVRLMSLFKSEKTVKSMEKRGVKSCQLSTEVEWHFATFLVPPHQDNYDKLKYLQRNNFFNSKQIHSIYKILFPIPAIQHFTASQADQAILASINAIKFFYLIVAIPITFLACSSISKQSMKNLPRSNLEIVRPGDLSWSVWNGAVGSSKSTKNKTKFDDQSYQKKTY